jgi:hypothetical protein
MDAAARDSTEDWVLPGRARPPLIGELERRIEVAMATAQASEAAVITVGAAALDAAEQARHAAELAERASGAALAAQGRVEAIAVTPPQPSPAEGSAGVESSAEAGDDSLGDFSARADRLVARLRQLQRVPLGGPAASDVSDPRQSAR